MSSCQQCVHETKSHLYHTYITIEVCFKYFNTFLSYNDDTLTYVDINDVFMII
jgi:hypothetical protein